MPFGACTAACTGVTESGSDSSSAEGAKPADFAAAVLMIERLPLSDAQKAEAIKRMLDQAAL